MIPLCPEAVKMSCLELLIAFIIVDFYVLPLINNLYIDW